MYLNVTVKIIEEGPIRRLLPPTEEYMLTLCRVMKKNSNSFMDKVNLTRLIMSFGATDSYTRVCSIEAAVKTSFPVDDEYCIFREDDDDLSTYREVQTSSEECTFRCYPRAGPIRDSMGVAMDKGLFRFDEHFSETDDFTIAGLKVHVNRGYVQRRNKPAVICQMYEYDGRGRSSVHVVTRLLFYMRRGRLHRYLYPAAIQCTRTGAVIEDGYFLNGKPVSDEVHETWGRRRRQLRKNRRRRLKK